MIFDTASLYFRAFFGVPTSLRDATGRPVNAVRGLLDAIARLVEQYSPTHIACAWDDDWRPMWRVALVPSYKTHRLIEGDVAAEETPDELSPQVPMIRDALAALGIPVIGMPDYEADDVLASLASQFDGEALVVTGDRDLFQLVSDHISVIYVGRGVAKHDLVDAAWVQQKYGVPPERYVDFAVLRGDPSDGLPGVKGIGDKSAATLVTQYGGLDDIASATADPASGMAPGMRTKILAASDYLPPAREVVTAVRTLELPQVAPLSPAQVDEARFAALASELNLGGSATRVLSALTTAGRQQNRPAGSDEPRGIANRVR